MEQCKCHNLKLGRDLRCTVEMMELCRKDDGVGCDGFGHTLISFIRGEAIEVYEGIDGC